MADWLAELQINRAMVLAAIERCPGLHCAASEGAFYAFVNCAGVIGAATQDGTILRTDLDFANYLLDAAHVGVVHGSAFGVEDHIRIAYAVAGPTLQDACRRIEAACTALVPSSVETSSG